MTIFAAFGIFAEAEFRNPCDVQCDMQLDIQCDMQSDIRCHMQSMLMQYAIHVI